MAKGFDEFQAIFGEPNAEWDSSNSSSGPPLLPFLFHVHALDTYSLRIHVTDFHSYTWEATRSIQQLQDMRDNTGVGGSWIEFVEYLIESLKSDNVRLVVGSAKSKNSAGDHGSTSARLIAHKSKGMPRISISLQRLMETSASDAMANLSLGLFKAFKGKHHLATKVPEEQERGNVAKNSYAEQAKKESCTDQIDAALSLKRQKLQKVSALDKTLPANNGSHSDIISASDKYESPRKPLTQDPRSTKVGNRAAPAYRRARVRGAVIDDTEDGDDN